MSENLFMKLGLDEKLASALSRLGFEEPTPIQTHSIPALLEGRDVLGQAATGTGKTAAFSLPLIQRYCLNSESKNPKVLILTPTRELCIQVSEAILSYSRDSGVYVTPIYGGQDYSRQIKALNRGVHIVVATPGRALDHIRRGTLRLQDIQAVVLDEADEMLDMGFAEDLDAILSTLPEERQTALFSATLPARITKMAENQLNNPYRILIPKEKVPEGEQPKVRQSAYIVGRNHRVAALGRILDIESPRLAIVFARTRNEVDELAESLRGRGYSVEPLHGGLDQAQRDRVMKRARAEQVDVIVATDVAARGIDIEHLTHVINYGIPATTETYVHRIGRTGRAGREGTAITILEPRESRLLKNIERMTKQKIQILSVPTATDVHAKRLDLTRASVHEILVGENDLGRYRSIVETLSNDFDVLDVAAAAVKLANENNWKDSYDVEIPSQIGVKEEGRKPRKPSKSPRRTSEGMVRLFIGTGRDSGIRPQDLVGAIANEAGVSSKLIGSIDIADRYSIVEVDEEIAQNVIFALRSAYIKGKQCVVRYDRPPEERGFLDAEEPVVRKRAKRTADKDKKKGKSK